MAQLVIVTGDGEEHEVQADENRSLMETIRERGFSELRALCGGCCSCATCHVFIDPARFASLPEMSTDEDALLDGSPSRRAASRLSCQIRIAAEMEGLKVTIVPHDD